MCLSSMQCSSNKQSRFVIIFIIAVGCILVVVPFVGKLFHTQTAKDPGKSTKALLIITEIAIFGNVTRPFPAQSQHNLLLFRRLQKRIFDRLHQNFPGALESTADPCRDKRQNRFLTFDSRNGDNGELGSFMFLTASTIALARNSCRTALIPDTYGQRAKFGNPLPLPPSADIFQNKQTRYINTSSTEFPSSTLSETLAFLNPSNVHDTVCLQGSLQSWKYFQRSRNEIRQQFTFIEPVYHAAFSVLSARMKEYRKSFDRVIGINIHRGYIPDADVHKFVLSAYHKMNRMYKSKAVFIVVSNDPAYSATLFFGRSNVLVIQPGSPEVALSMLSLMDDLILTIGSLGWWAAYLSDARRVMYYRDWLKPSSGLDNMYRAEEYFLPEWIAHS